MKTIKIISILLIAYYLGFSCQTATYDEISVEVAKPTYTVNVRPIINNNCFPCHSAAGGQYPVMETFVQAREAAEIGDMICRIDDQSCGLVMPQKGRMPQTNINTIKKWVANEYPN